MRRLLVVGLLVAVLGIAGAPAAQAHPLGNVTVNHYDGLVLAPDRITDTAVVDTAEIPTLQRRPTIDGDGDGAISPAEASGYAVGQCAGLAAAVAISVDGTRLGLAVTSSTYLEQPGAVALTVGRLTCELAAPADLTRPATVAVADEWDSAGIGGWHEITARGEGVTLTNSPVPPTSSTDELRRYPEELLSSPLDVRRATISSTPGAGASSYRPAAVIPGADVVTRALAGVTTTFNGLATSRDLTIGVGLLAVLLAALLGAGHAFLPGHGKTIMAAYLVSRQGRLRDVVTVGVTVTVTHTVGVLALGLLLTASAALAPTAVLQWLAVLSGLIVVGVGVGLLVPALRRRGSSAAHAAMEALAVPEPEPITQHHPHPAPGGDGESAEPAAARGSVLDRDLRSEQREPPVPGSTGHGHSHGHSHGHGHGHGPGFGRGGLIGLGMAGGLVPSPSALLVLVAAIGLGRTVFGIVLVLAYGLGMAAALSVAGVLLVRLRGRLARLVRRPGAQRLTRLVAVLPVLTALLVIVVGAGLVVRALTGSV